MRSFRRDTLGRRTRMTFQDGSARQYSYDEAGDAVNYIDENGSEFASTFDPLGRKTECDITRAGGVLGTDEQDFEYDGLSRATESDDVATV